MVGSTRKTRQTSRKINYRENKGSLLPKRSVDQKGRPHMSKAKRASGVRTDPYRW